MAALERLLTSEARWDRLASDNPMGAVRLLGVLAAAGDRGEELVTMALTRRGSGELFGVTDPQAVDHLTRGLAGWQAAAVLAIDEVCQRDDTFALRGIRQQASAIAALIRRLPEARKIRVLSQLEILQGFDRSEQVGAFAGMVRELEPRWYRSVREVLRADASRSGMGCAGEDAVSRLDTWLRLGEPALPPPRAE
ncbi:MAG: hypothetical protein JNL45_14395 [Hyphomicrobium sp.]|nr:hypothetical protein [Hyphomicrobium sp.]